MEEQKFIAAAIIAAGMAANVAYQDYSASDLAQLAVRGADKLYEIFKKRESDGK